MKKLKFLVGLILVFNAVSANNSLRIVDPQAWGSSAGMVTDLDIEVTPAGAYFKYDMEITFAAALPGNFGGGSRVWDISPSLLYTNMDTVSSISNTAHIERPLEIQYSFNLPKEAIVTDSWLWIDGKPVRADILDAWTATMIYEGIVNRNQDPSLFKKISSTRYSLNIYPLDKDGSRKIKLSVLLPAEWDTEKVVSYLPVAMFYNIDFRPKDINIKLNTSQQWKNPEIPFNEIDTNNTLTVNASDFLNSSLSASYDNPANGNNFFSVYQHGSEWYYQLVTAPESREAAGIKDIIFVVDKYRYSDAAFSSMIDYLYNYIFAQIRKGAKINIVFHNGQAAKLVSGWLDYSDPIAFKNLFEAIKTVKFESGHTLDLVEKAIEHKNETGIDAEIVLISNVPQYYQKKSLKDVVNTLYSKYPELPPIYVIESIVYYNYYDWDNYTNLFLEALAKRTMGNYKKLEQLSEIGSTIDELFSSKNLLNRYDFNMSPLNGFSYGIFNIGQPLGLDTLKPLMQVGKFIGELPVEISLKYIGGGVLAEKKYSFTQADTFEAESTLMQIWAGQKIAVSEKVANGDNKLQAEIAEISLEHRVLSFYTAFLAIEPHMDLDSLAQNIDPNDFNNGDRWLMEDMFFVTNDTEIDEEINKIEVYTNSNSANVSVLLAGNEEIISIKLFDISGLLLKEYDINSSSFEINKADAGGFAILSVTTTDGTYYKKIVL
jgi:hypothetical protein